MGVTGKQSTHAHNFPKNEYFLPSCSTRFEIHPFIYLFIFSFFYIWLAANEITVYNKNSYVYIHANWRQLPNVEKMKNCKINIKKKKKKKNA